MTSRIPQPVSFSFCCFVGLIALSGRAIAQCSWIENHATAGQATFLGNSVALEGDLALAGAMFDSTQGVEAGSAHLFSAQSGWAELSTLLPSDASAGKRFGASVALSGDCALVGAPTINALGGSVYVFQRDQGGVDAWGQVDQILIPVAGAVGQFGSALATDRDTLVVGAQLTDGYSGSAYVFRRAAGTSSWGFVRELRASDAGPLQYFGSSVAVHDDQIVVGAVLATNPSGVACGAAYVFERDAGGPDSWMEVAKLTPADGQDNDRFGNVSVGPNTVVVGSPFRLEAAVSAGAAYVFERNTLGQWNQVRKLTASDGGFNHQFGCSVALRGNEVLIGAWRAAVNGEAYVFERDFGGPGQWGERERIGPAWHPTSSEWFFGWDVDFAPGRRLVGSPGPSSAPAAGLIYVYEGTPELSNYCVQPSTVSGCSPRISTIGCPSATGTTPFRVLAHGLDAQEFAIFFYGVSGRISTPWGTGGANLCVHRALQRTQVQFTAGTPGRCDGTAELDWSAFVASHPDALGQLFMPGQTINMQAIGRHSSSWGIGALSDAVEFTLAP